MDYRPKKRVKIAKVGLFDTLPMEILYTIGDWFNSLKDNDKHMAIVKRIKSPKNPILCKIAYTHLKPYHNFGPLSLYCTNNYKWVHRYYEMNRIGFGPKTHLTKNKPA